MGEAHEGFNMFNEAGIESMELQSLQLMPTAPQRSVSISYQDKNIRQYPGMIAMV